MIAGAIELVRRGGIAATSIRDVVEYTGTPRGSVSHHFPGGKHELMADALRLAGEEVSTSLRAALDQGVREGLSNFIDYWCELLSANEFSHGCAILAGAVEYDQPTDQKPTGASPRQPALSSIANDVFCEWQDILADAIEREGAPHERALNIATMVVSSLEGAIVLCRAAKNTAPLRRVAAEFHIFLEQLNPNGES